MLRGLQKKKSLYLKIQSCLRDSEILDINGKMCIISCPNCK